MGNGLSENQSVEYESGAGRLLKSIFMAICVAPLLILAMCGTLGWNERRAVCDQKAVSAGSSQVTEVQCDNAMASNGDLVMFSCPIDPTSLKTFSVPTSDFAGIAVKGTGLKVESWMYQCIEKDSTRTEKQAVGGGKKTIHTYTYQMDWRSDWVDSSRFHALDSPAWRQGPCRGMHNPRWPSGVPRTESFFASSMKVGQFTTTMTDSVPLDTPVTDDQVNTPQGWKKISLGSFSKRSHATQIRSGDQIGDVKVTLSTNARNDATVTVLGQNNAGSIVKWTAPSSWLCSGFSLMKLRMGMVDKENFFAQMHAEAHALTWVLRLVCFILMWLAFCLCFGPLEVAGDCIPCIGPCIGDNIAAITCCVACLPATACTFGVAGLVWVAMRPLLGIPMLLIFICVFGGLGAYIAKQRKDKGGRVLAAGTPYVDYGAANPSYGQLQITAPVAMAIAVPAQPVQPQRQMQVQVPPGSGPGELMQFQTPDGNSMQATVPNGVAPGGVFTVSY